MILWKSVLLRSNLNGKRSDFVKLVFYYGWQFMATIQQKQLFTDEILGPVGDAAQTGAHLGGKLTGFLVY